MRNSPPRRPRRRGMPFARPVSQVCFACSPVLRRYRSVCGEVNGLKRLYSVRCSRVSPVCGRRKRARLCLTRCRNGGLSEIKQMRTRYATRWCAYRSGVRLQWCLGQCLSPFPPRRPPRGRFMTTDVFHFLVSEMDVSEPDMRTAVREGLLPLPVPSGECDGPERR